MLVNPCNTGLHPCATACCTLFASSYSFVILPMMVLIGSIPFTYSIEGPAHHTVLYVAPNAAFSTFFIPLTARIIFAYFFRVLLLLRIHSRKFALVPSCCT